MFKRLNVVLMLAAAILSGCKSFSAFNQSRFSHFTGLTDFSNFARSQNSGGETVLLSPEVKSPSDWNELVVSWNAAAPAGSYLKIEARAIAPNHSTKFYAMGLWTPDDQTFPRASVGGQHDADGDVNVDTLVLNQSASAVQIRLTPPCTSSIRKTPGCRTTGLDIGEPGSPKSTGRVIALQFHPTKTFPTIAHHPFIPGTRPIPVSNNPPAKTGRRGSLPRSGSTLSGRSKPKSV